MCTRTHAYEMIADDCIATAHPGAARAAVTFGCCWAAVLIAAAHAALRCDGCGRCTPLCSAAPRPHCIATPQLPHAHCPQHCPHDCMHRKLAAAVLCCSSDAHLLLGCCPKSLCCCARRCAAPLRACVRTHTQREQVAEAVLESCCAVLCCDAAAVLLCCAVLCCAVRRGAVRCGAVLCHAVLCCARAVG